MLVLSHPVETHTIAIVGNTYRSMYRGIVQVCREMTVRQIARLVKDLKRDGWVEA